MDRSFEVFNINGTKNREITRFAPLELKINNHTERINVKVTDLNGIDIFLGYNWLVKYNPEVNQEKETIQFIRYPRKCKMQYQNILFISRTQRLKPIEDIKKE